MTGQAASTFPLPFGILKCGKLLRVYHIPTSFFLYIFYLKCVKVYADSARKFIRRLTGVKCYLCFDTTHYLSLPISHFTLHIRPIGCIVLK